MAKFRVSENGITDHNGKIVFQSFKRFKTDVVDGGHCFICGISPTKAIFNEEHILPKWLLRKFDIFNVKFQMPNQTGIHYHKYTIPCCKSCNSIMSSVFEVKISKAVEEGYDAFTALIRTEGRMFLFQWLAIIFSKTYLKDMQLELHRDKRLPPGKIGHIYEYQLLHHIHCIARSFYTGAKINPRVMGSLLILRASTIERDANYDYGDLLNSRTMFIQMGEIAIICSFDDSGIIERNLRPLLSKISGPVSNLQIRELFFRFALKYYQLRRTPHFFSTINKKMEYYIYTKIPNIISFENSISYELIKLYSNLFRNNMDFCEIEFENIPTSILNTQLNFRHEKPTVFDPSDILWSIQNLKNAGVSEENIAEIVGMIKGDFSKVQTNRNKKF